MNGKRQRKIDSTRVRQTEGEREDSRGGWEADRQPQIQYAYLQHNSVGREYQPGRGHIYI